jgi:hypothetical protein
VRKCESTLSHLGPTTYEDAAASANQKRLALILGAMVLFFLLRVLRELF